MIKRNLLLFCCLFAGSSCVAQNWAEWFRQNSTQRKYLLQQIVRLQLYLQYAQKGYRIAQDGLTLIGDIKTGDFSLHRLFFDHLNQVAPGVRNSSKVQDILIMEQKMLAAYSSRLKQLTRTGNYTEAELTYINRTFSTLFEELDATVAMLSDVLTPNTFEMSDQERLKRIDNLYDITSKKYRSCFSLLNRITLLAKNRHWEQSDLLILQNLY